ncbi:caspase family protein, partial [Streptomyces aurantiacus]
MTLPDPHGTRAVLIGVSEYTSLHKLPAVRNNVAALREILTSSYSWNLPSRHCVTIHNPKTPEELVDPILRCVEEATDTLLVYYAGHGLKGANRGEFRLSRSTSRAGAPHTSTDYDDIREALIESTANRRIVILDCCYAASALGVMADPVDSVAEDAIVEGTYLIAASGETQAAISEDGSGFTAFTGELVRLLRDGVPDTTKKFMDLDTIFTHLRSSLRAKARPLPHRRVRNSPGGLTLAWNRQWVGWFDASHLSGEQAYRPLTSDQAAQVVASESAKALDRRPGGWPTAKTVKPSSTTSETVTPAIQQPGAWPPADTVAPPAAPEATTPAARRPGGWPTAKTVKPSSTTSETVTPAIQQPGAW